MGLSAFLHSWGLPREPQETQEGSQEAPKELQKPQKKVWSWTQKLINYSPILEPKLGPKRGNQKPLQKRAP